MNCQRFLIVDEPGGLACLKGNVSWATLRIVLCQDKRVYDLTEYLINSEMMFFPALVKMDGLDSMSRFYDLNMNPPMIYDDIDVYPEHAGDD